MHSKLQNIFCIIFVFLTGCMMVGPNYKKPQIKISESFKHAQLPNEILDLNHWWEVFNDNVLSDLIKKALENNYNLHKAMEHVEEFRALYNIQQAQLFPEIDGTGVLDRLRYSDSLLFFDLLNVLTYNYGQVGLSASWEIDVWGRLRRLKKAVHAEFRTQVEAMRDLYIIIIANVAYAYIEIRALEEKIAIQQKIIELDEQLFTLATILFSSGIESAISPNQYNEKLQEDRNLLHQYYILKAQQIHGLAVLLGENPEIFKLPETFLCGVPYVTLSFDTGLPSELLRRRPDIRKAEALVESTNEYIGAAIADYFPRFSLLGNFGVDTNYLADFFKGGSITWTVGPSFDWRLLTFGRISCNVQAKKSVHYQAISSYAQTILDAFKEVENGLVAYFENQKRVRFLSEKSNSVTAISALNDVRYQAGLVSLLPALSTQRDTLGVFQQVIDAQMATSASLVLLCKALGGGWDHATICN